MKSEIDVLRFLLALENIMNIHRDYFSLNKRKQIIVALCIILDTVLTSVVFVVCSVHYIEITSNHRSILQLMSFLVLYLWFGFLVTLYFGLKHGQGFGKVLKYLNKGHINAQRNLIYTKSLQSLKIKVYITITFFLISRLVVFLIPYKISDVYAYFIRDYDGIYYITYVILRTWTEFRFGLELVFFYSLLSVLSFMVGHLANLVKQCQCCNTQLAKATEKFNAYARMYHELFECSKQLMQCFGSQVSFILK